MATKVLNSGNNLVTIWNGTYTYCQKSSNYYMQKQIYSLERKCHLVKTYIAITTNELYLDVWEPKNALSNDTSIMNNLLDDESFRNFFKNGDILSLTEVSEVPLKNSSVMNSYTKYRPV